MALTAKGFERLSFTDILESKIAKAKELFGEDIDTPEHTPLGKFIRINAYDLADAEEEAEYIYYSIFPNTARGVSLDRLCVFVGITRNPAVASKYKVKVTGESGYTVPIGFVVGTTSGINFYNISDTEITEGECEITVYCTQTGTEGNIEAALITQVINPVAYVTAVQGFELIESGSDDETDSELRKRFEEAREGSGACTESSIKAALMRVTSVESVNIITNETTETDSGGRPPFSFECFIKGGENYHSEIAETIYNKKPIGIKTYGTESVEYTDEYGITYTIMFSHTTEVKVTVLYMITTNSSFNPTSGYDEIAANLQEHINSLGVGEDVILTSLYGQIHAVEGVVEVTNLKLKVSGGTYATGNISIAENEIAKFYAAVVDEDEEVELF
ncbi:MAG: baseplate J/gp47 family protein [Clostridiales bacterium]|nr:baseplate J/gp47 family protein [Clostridiales bacterium]